MTDELVIPEDLKAPLDYAQRGLSGRAWPLKARDRVVIRLIERIARQDAAIKTLRGELKGLFMRHCDGSDEMYWAEWDDARAALKETEEQG